MAGVPLPRSRGECYCPPLLAPVMKPRGRCGRRWSRRGSGGRRNARWERGAPSRSGLGEVGRSRRSRGRGTPKAGDAGWALFGAACGVLCLIGVDIRDSHSQIINKFRASTRSAFTRLFPEDLLGRSAAAEGM